MAGVMAYTVAKMKYVEVEAVASRQMEDACTFALKHDLGKAYGKYEEMMKDKDVDLVYIASPHSQHAVHAGTCINQKKPVLVEKSFTANAEQGIRVILQEESYTSRADVTACDAMPVYGQETETPVFSGKRIKRGLYQCHDRKLINADCNGAANICRKAFPAVWEGCKD